MPPHRIAHEPRTPRRRRTRKPASPVRPAHTVSLGSRALGSQDYERKRLEAAAGIVAEAARRISSVFSRRIPGSVRVVTYQGRTYVEAGGPGAEHAYAFDPPPARAPSRHPLFGLTGRANTKRGKPGHGHWYPQPYRPFLEEAADEAIDRAAVEYSKVIDDWCRETGLTEH